jgi:tetratricopeptide (TPR) repeat protein
MASYKKRGYKNKQTKENDQPNDVDTQDSTTAEVFESLDQSASKTEEFISKYQKQIFGAIIVVVVVVLGSLAYQKFIVEPTEAEAANELNQAQMYFKNAIEASGKNAKDSLYTLSLDGGNGKFGFTDIASQYSGTKSGNLANYYAGMSYFKLSNYEKAIEYLDAFSSDDELLMPMAQGTIADAFQQIGQTDKALDYYEKAANLRSNSFTTSKYLLKAAITAIELGKADIALEHLNNLKDNYSETEEAKQADVYLGQAEAMQ